MGIALLVAAVAVAALIMVAVIGSFFMFPMGSAAPEQAPSACAAPLAAANGSQPPAGGAAGAPFAAADESMRAESPTPTGGQAGAHETGGAAGQNLLRDAAVGGAVVLVLAAFGAYLVITRRQGAEFEIPDAEVHRALSSETRLGLLHELQARDLTPTDLSTRVGKSKATVVEHLDRLIDFGFVERKEEEGKKFVFYGLTRKGKEVLRRAG